MAATQLGLYNAALLELGERRLSALTDETEGRRALDDVWGNGEIKDLWLQQGHWNFAMRTVELTFSPSITPGFGYQYAFDKPDDWVRTSGISADEYFSTPLNAYYDEQAFWFCDYETIYVRYVSNDSDFGYDMTRWPPSFVRWIETYLAYRIAVRVTGSTKVRDDLYGLQQRMLTEARSHDAMNDPAGFPPSGSWVRSRTGYGSAERGNRRSLIG
jgi:hypothetical protein